MSVIRVEDIAFVRFQAPDLKQMQTFLEEFGLRCFEQGGRLYARASDGAPFNHVTENGDARFLGLGFRASSRADLDMLAESEGALVQPAETPGGGYVVRLRDPDGNTVDVVAEQSWDAPEALEPETAFNSIHERRRLREPVRLAPRPSKARRLGHALLMVTDFAASAAWYQERLGFLNSDRVEAEPGLSIGAFMRCDRGDRLTDHHTLALIQLPDAPRFGHAAFEVGGLDDLMLGHTFLKARRRPHAWGVGRHKLGSQIFDYWRDPWGNELEHWTDGDLFTAADASGVATVEEVLGVQWGAPNPMLAAQEG